MQRRGNSHDEIRELLGAYALGAVDAREARFIASHLRACRCCRAEVHEHREVATALWPKERT